MKTSRMAALSHAFASQSVANEFGRRLRLQDTTTIMIVLEDSLKDFGR